MFLRENPNDMQLHSKKPLRNPVIIFTNRKEITTLGALPYSICYSGKMSIYLLPLSLTKGEINSETHQNDKLPNQQSVFQAQFKNYFA